LLLLLLLLLLEEDYNYLEGRYESRIVIVAATIVGSDCVVSLSRGSARRNRASVNTVDKTVDKTADKTVDKTASAMGCTCCTRLFSTKAGAVLLN
jgi:hypothetical protein